MQRLTLTGRIVLAVVLLAALFGAYKYFGGQEGLKTLTTKEATESENYKTPEPTDTEASSDASSTAASESSSSSSSASSEASDTGGSRAAFSYTPPAPTDGKLKGVVELGASGFNSFIVRMDADKHWKLEKAEFGNSLVIENMASDEDIRAGLKKYIGGMLDFGVSGRNIHFVASSGALKAEVTQKILKNLKSLNYVVNAVTPQQEGRYALKSVLPDAYRSKAFVTDIGSGNTKISWVSGSSTEALDTYGAKYFQEGTDDAKVYDAVKSVAKQIPSDKRDLCFIIGGVPFEMAKKVRNGKERYTVLDAPSAYKMDNAKSKAGVNIYKAIADATGCKQFVFDWDANFTIGALLELPY